MRRGFIRAPIPLLIAALSWSCQGKQHYDEAYAATSSAKAVADDAGVEHREPGTAPMAAESAGRSPDSAMPPEYGRTSRRRGYSGVPDARRAGEAEPSVILVRSFHDRNFNGVQDPGEEELDGRALEVTDPELRSFTVYMPTMIVAREAGTYTLIEVTPDGAHQTVRGLNGAVLSLHPNADPVVAVLVESSTKRSQNYAVSYGYVGLGQVRACKIFDEDGDGSAEPGEPGLRGWWMELSGTDAQGEPVRPLVRTTGEDGCVTFTGLLPGDYTVSEAVPAAGSSETNDTASHTVTIASSVHGSSLSGSVATVNFTLSKNVGLRYQDLLTDQTTSNTDPSTRHR